MNPSQDTNSAPMNPPQPQDTTTTNQQQDIDSVLTNVAVSTVQRLAASSDKCKRHNVDFEKVRRKLLQSGSKNNILEEHKQEQTIQPSILPVGFRPSKNSVILGRGREPKEHAGNQKLRTMTMMYLDEYAKAEYDKVRKTEIVSLVVSLVNQSCHKGIGFVKRRKDGRWEEVGGGAAREKVGYTFRDLLADKYLSSSKSKVAKKNAMKSKGGETSSGIANDHTPLDWRHDPNIPLKSVFDVVPTTTTNATNMTMNQGYPLPLNNANLAMTQHSFMRPNYATVGVDKYRRFSLEASTMMKSEFGDHRNEQRRAQRQPTIKRMSAPPDFFHYHHETNSSMMTLPSMSFQTTTTTTNLADSRPNQHHEEGGDHFFDQLLKTAKEDSLPLPNGNKK